MKIYNKLVRDNIPEVIKASGKTCEIEIVNGKEKQELLEKKLLEEVNEYLEDKNLEELADVKRNEKLEKRGGFKEGIVLLNVFK